MRHKNRYDFKRKQDILKWLEHSVGNCEKVELKSQNKKKKKRKEIGNIDKIRSKKYP